MYEIFLTTKRPRCSRFS